MFEYNISLAGVPIAVNCNYPFAAFEEFRTEEEAIETIKANPVPFPDLQNSPGAEESRASEFMQLLGDTGSSLLKYSRCIFHGAAFFWKGKAWIFTGPSGIGKTTQYVLWKLLFGDELQIINGDKPILEFRENGQAWVHPSPWKGKENMGTDRSALLGGIILLKQGTENRVRKLSPASAAKALYLQFLFADRSAECVDLVCSLENRLLESCPVWEMVNQGGKESAELIHEVLRNWEEHAI